MYSMRAAHLIPISGFSGQMQQPHNQLNPN
jgi:hypothetical protein